MNKKSLLCTTIASTMLLAGITFPMSNAAVEKKAGELVGETTIAYTSFNTTQNEENVVTKNAITIELTGKNRQLTEENLETIVKQKFGDDVKFEIIKNGNEEEGLVGTGTKVKISDSKVFVVELLGDVDGTGTIDENDAQQIFNYAFFEKAEALATDSQKVAANVEADEAIDENDAQQIFNYAFYEGETTDGKMMDYVNNELPTDETFSILNITDKDDEGKELDVPDLNDVASGLTTNQSNVQGISVEGTTVTVEGKLESMSEVEFPEVEGIQGETSVTPENINAYARNVESDETTAEKWYAIKINTGIDNYKIEGAQYVIDEEDEQPIIFLVAQDKDCSFNVINGDDQTEKVELTVKFIDMDTPDVSAISKVEEDSRNQSLVTVTSELEHSNTVTVTRNINKMIEDENNVKSYKLQLTTVAGNEEEVADKEVFDAEKLVAIEKVGEDGGFKKLDITANENIATISLDATKSTEIKLINKNVFDKKEKEIADANAEAGADVEQHVLKYTELSEAETITITTSDSTDTKIKVGNVVKSSTGTNSNKVTVQKNEAGDIIVEAPLNELKAEVLGNDNKIIDPAEDASGKNYYAFAVDVGCAVADLGYNTGSDEPYKIISTSNKNLTTNFSGVSSSFRNTLIVILDAEKDKEETTIEIRTKTDAANQKDYPEICKLKVKFKDTSDIIDEKVAVELPENTTNENVNYNNKTVKNIPAFTATSDKATVQPSVRMAALKELDEDGHKYYPLIVKTGADREVLKIKYPTPSKKEINCADEDFSTIGGTEVLEDDEILIWVKADTAAEQKYEITNINKSTNKFTLTVKNSNASDLKLSEDNKKKVHVLTSVTEGDVNNIKAFLQGNYEKYTNNKANVYQTFTAKTASAKDGIVATEWDRTFIVQAYLNQLETFELYGQMGKWCPIMLNVTDVTRLKEGWTDETTHIAYIDKTNTTAFGGTSIKQVLLWVNLEENKNAVLATVSESETTKTPTKDITITSKPDNLGVVEEVTVRLAIEDKSAGFTEETKENTKTPENTAIESVFTGNKEAEKEHVEKNSGLVDDIEFNGNTEITVKADLKDMDHYEGGYTDAEGKNDYVYIPIVLDLGIAPTELCYGETWQEDHKVEQPAGWNLTGNQWLQWFVFKTEDVANLNKGDKKTKTMLLTHKDAKTELTETITLTINFEQSK